MRSNVVLCCIFPCEVEAASRLFRGRLAVRDAHIPAATVHFLLPIRLVVLVVVDGCSQLPQPRPGVLITLSAESGFTPLSLPSKTPYGNVIQRHPRFNSISQWPTLNRTFQISRLSKTMYLIQKIR